MLPPPQAELPVLRKITDAYKLWHSYHGTMERLSRYTLGATIDKIFCEAIELTLQSGFAAREQKQPLLLQASTKIDSLKFFLQVAWETKALDHKKFGALSELICEIGKNIGSWRNRLKNNELPQ